MLKTLEAEHIARSTEPILLWQPTLEHLQYVLSCEPRIMNGARRLVYCIEPKFSGALKVKKTSSNNIYRHEGSGSFGRDGYFGVHSSIENFVSTIHENINLPIPIRFLDCSGASKGAPDELKVATQKSFRARYDTIQNIIPAIQDVYAKENILGKMHEGEYPLRILFRTSRFTSVLQYMSRDLASGFAALGHKTMIVTENEPFEKPTILTPLHAMLTFKPHIVIDIDHNRVEQFDKLTGFIHLNWIQDDLGHLWDKGHINKLTANDYTLCMFPKIAAKAVSSGYQQDHVIMFQVGANTDIFRPDVDQSDEEGPDIVFPCNIDAQANVMDKTRMDRRIQPVIWALEMGLRVDVYGSGWDKAGLEHPLLRVYPRVENGPDLARIYRSGKFVLHANNDTNCHQRVFETIACYRLPLVWALPNDMEDGGLGSCLNPDHHMIRFTDRESFQRELKIVNSDGALYADMCELAFKALLEQHTYKHRIESLLANILKYTPVIVPEASESETSASPSENIQTPPETQLPLLLLTPDPVPQEPQTAPDPQESAQQNAPRLTLVSQSQREEDHPL